MAMRRPWDVSDALWKLFKPLLPKVERRCRYPGRKRLDDRKALQGILFVLYTGIAWRRRLDEWQRAGVWDRLHELLLARLNEAERID
jgi:transposase